MNKIYRLIWSRTREMWIAVNEKVAAGWFRRPLTVGSLVAAALLATASPARALDPNALPTGGQVVSGQAAINQSGNALTIQQSTDKLIANWNTFNIGQNASVAFQQPGASSVALNRILDQNPSQIFGSLTANGQVFLLNPAGVYFGSTATIDVGGLVAAAMNLSDEKFLSGKYLFEKNTNAGSIVNQGQIRTADGGYVAFLSPVISNEGTIITPSGKTALAAGDKISLDFTGDKLVSFTVNQGAVNSLIENKGLIQAEGGLVKMTAKSADALINAVVNNTGIIEAKGIVNQNGRIILDADQIQQTGTLDVSGSPVPLGGEVNGGSINLFATGMVMNTGSLHATGNQGGNIDVSGRAIVEAGKIDASGSTKGGKITLAAKESIEQVFASTLKADAAQGQAGSVRVEAGQSAYLSGSLFANGQTGGQISVTAGDLRLAGATLTADGAQGGGLLRVGGGWQGKDADLKNAKTTTLMSATLSASATQKGKGGTVAVWSEENTSFNGSIGARGGAQGGDGGKVEVSSHGLLGFGGTVDVSAPNGQNGNLLLDPKNIEIVSGGGGGGGASTAVIPLAYANPQAGDKFGAGGYAYELKNGGSSTGNIAVTNVYDNTAASKAGAVRIFNMTTGALLSTLTGSQANDAVGHLAMALGNGNFVTWTSSWAAGTATNAGAVTWIKHDGTLSNGATGGVVSAANSLVGVRADDSVGFGDVTALKDANKSVVVVSPKWDNGTMTDAGAVTWINGSNGKLVGGATGGVITSDNSLIGSKQNDMVGLGRNTSATVPTYGSEGVVALENGNYVVNSQRWSNGTVANVGAVTWGYGAMGTTGVVSAYNSLLGGSAGDRIGAKGIYALSNGNYVVASPFWASGTSTAAGAATWVDGANGYLKEMGTRGGVVSSSNSLVGEKKDSRVSYQGVVEVGSSNYVVVSSDWVNGTATKAGAVTWGNGSAGTSGVISSANSLVGDKSNSCIGASGITVLANGHYVVSSVRATNGTVTNVGAVTWGSGSAGVSGVVSAANSLMGQTANDCVGSRGIYALDNGNYVVLSPYWDLSTSAQNAGAVTWSKGDSAANAVKGTVSSTNSLLGKTADDVIGSSGVVMLKNNHNFVILSPNWDYSTAAQNAGAVTWGSGSAGISGALSSSNSLVGTTSGDNVGADVIALSNGNYVARNLYWNNSTASKAGAVTWGNGATGITGAVSVANSLVGSTKEDYLGSSGIYALENGNYVVSSALWDNGTSAANAGAITWGDGTTGLTGTVSAANSLVGNSLNDCVGSGGITLLSGNNNYVVRNPYWDNGAILNAGAVTWSKGDSAANAAKGIVSSDNSLVGSTANDYVGSGSVISIPNGDYVVRSYSWNNGTLTRAGALTWGAAARASRVW